MHPRAQATARAGGAARRARKRGGKARSRRRGTAAPDRPAGDTRRVKEGGSAARRPLVRSSARPIVGANSARNANATRARTIENALCLAFRATTGRLNRRGHAVHVHPMFPTTLLGNFASLVAALSSPFPFPSPFPSRSPSSSSPRRRVLLRHVHPECFPRFPASRSIPFCATLHP